MKFHSLKKTYLNMLALNMQSHFQVGLQDFMLLVLLLELQIMIRNTSPITFVATSNSVLYCGEIQFSDISNDSINICPDNLESLIKKNPNVKAIIPVHFAGVSCDMEKIKIIAIK